MENTELLEAISRMMDEKLDKALQPINARLDRVDSRLDKIEDDIDELKESCEVTRVAVNTLIDWTDQISTVEALPLPRIKG